MSNLIINWWRSQQFKLALQRGDTQKAIRILQEIQKSGARLSWLEKLFKNKLLLERDSREYKREYKQITQQIVEYQKSKSENKLKTNPKFIDYIYQVFKIINHDKNKLQVTGIDEELFNNLELILVEYLQQEFSKFSEQTLVIKLKEALEDINGLKVGNNPEYNFGFTPHVYFMKYFLENVYCLYLAWLFIYQDGLLTSKCNILDLAAGPATSAYGLALLFQSCKNFFKLPQIHISYYSFEKQDAFQYRGLQFWRKYIESRINPINMFFRFATADIFTWDVNSNNIPPEFFDFIVISHCFFADSAKREQANNKYKEIFSHALKNNGHVLLIVQDKKLFKAYNSSRNEDQKQEKIIVNQFITELDLKLVWYRYLTSTGLRKSLTPSEFTKFAQEQLPSQLYMTSLLQKYFRQRYHNHYTLDDYVILAQK
jgi:hypothetical protein